MKKEAKQEVVRCITVGTPIIIVDSYDHPDTMSALMSEKSINTRPVILWNCVDGFVGISQSGKDIIARMSDQQKKAAKQGVQIALMLSIEFPKETVLFVDNLHLFWDKPAVVQALQNVRDPFKASRRHVIALTLGSSLPNDLVQNVSFIEDELPDEEALSEKVVSVHRSAFGEDNELDAEELKQISQELRGTSPFRAEQLTAISLTKSGINRDRLRMNARKQIRDTPGLSVETGSESFDDIGGLEAIRSFLSRYFDGPRRPTVVVRIEELEKAMAGAETDSSGTSGDALGTLLTSMEDNRWTGCLAYGVSGCGKSLVAKAAANQFGAKAIRFDINACKGSLVGQSEANIRQAVDVLKAIGGDRVFFIASMNKIESLPPELRRRFAAGTWYFDIPDAEARDEIWKISAEQFGVQWDGYDAESLTGADIRDIVQRSFELNCETTEAAQYHVPLCKSAPDAINTSRKNARGRYLDAHVGGPYNDVADVESSYERSIDFS